MIQQVQSQCNEQLQRMHINSIKDAFKKAIASIEKARIDFETQYEEVKAIYWDDAEFFREDLNSIKRIAIQLVTRDNDWANAMKKSGKDGAIDVSAFITKIDEAKQKTIDYINSIK